jgi:hypothetical protein
MNSIEDQPLSADELKKINAYWRANMLFIADNLWLNLVIPHRAWHTFVVICIMALFEYGEILVIITDFESVGCIETWLLSVLSCKILDS